VLQCSVVGATGYTGAELIRLLAFHPQVKIAHLTTRSEEKIKASTLVPGLPKGTDYVIQKTSLKKIGEDSQVIFLALPHTTAMDAVAALRKYDRIIIDLSADFRLTNVRDFKTWYGVSHQHKALLKHAVYGLPEFYRHKIRQAQLIANPGCYPTSVILGLLPLVRERLIEFDAIIADCKSGTSGAGKKLSMKSHFSEVNENFNAYKVNQHQHTPEMNQVLSDAAVREKVSVTFVPHLLPVTRGILSTLYAKLRQGVKAAHVLKAYEKHYHSEPFVRFYGEGSFPSLREVQYTNFCDIGVQVNESNGQVIVISAIDNLLKGASGQAVQNMNIRSGFAEDLGLLN